MKLNVDIKKHSNVKEGSSPSPTTVTGMERPQDGGGAYQIKYFWRIR